MADLVKIAGWTGQTSAAVVFVHGLGGHAYGTWGHPSGDGWYWPRGLAERVPGLRTYVLGYDAPPTNWLGTAMPLQDRATNVAERLLGREELRGQPLIFVCHSLGGLIVKQVLVDLHEQRSRRPEAATLLAQVRGVVFVATPHSGSRSATWLERLRLLAWPSAIASQLVANDPTLRKLNVSYRGFADDRRTSLRHLVFYETQGTAAGAIVDETSSDPGLPGDPPIPIDADHVSIAKPRDGADLVAERVQRFVAALALPVVTPGDYTAAPLPDLARKPQFWTLVPKLVRAAVLLLAAAAVAVALNRARGVQPSGGAATPVAAPVVSFAAVDGAECLPMPAGVRIRVTVPGAEPQEAAVSGCEVRLAWALDWKAGQLAKIDVVGAASFERADAAKHYRLGDARWVVAMRPTATAPRLLVQLFDYASSDGGPEQPLAQFQTIVRNKIQMLAQSIALRNPLCAYVADLRVERTPRQLASSPNAAMAEWRSTGSLLFLSGLLFRRNADLMVRSQPFFGELSVGDVSRVQIDLRIDADEFSQTTDSHSLALLYALAMDARRRGQPNDVVYVFLGEAVSIAQGLDSTVPGVQLLKNAVRGALEGIGAPVPDLL